MSYSGVDTSFNGGIAGLTETFYKGNFFTALTATAGGGAGTSSTMYGNEDYTMLMGGIGSKADIILSLRMASISCSQSCL